MKTGISIKERGERTWRFYRSSCVATIPNCARGLVKRPQLLTIIMPASIGDFPSTDQSVESEEVFETLVDILWL